MTDREANLIAREQALLAREAADDDRRIERDHLAAQMREANENLVLATIRANELADECQRRTLEVTASEERFRSLVITSAALLFQAGGDGRIRVDPSSWSRLTGLDADFEEEQEPGWGWLHAVHPDDQIGVREAWARATSTQQVYALQHRLLKPDGSYAWVMARAVPLLKNGKVSEWVGMMTDISDRMRMEEARDLFIAILGHDLRNPVSAITMSASLLMDEEVPANRKKLAARVTRSARRIDSMIRDILDFARGRLGRGIPIQRQACDLGKVCVDAVSELKQAHPERTITLETVGDLTGEWDRDRLEQVLSNLIGNAIEQGPEPIAVRLVAEGDEVLLAVHNRGQVIPAKQVTTIFEPFHRRLGESSKGLGLGLYIVTQVVRAHGGSISVSSSEHDGTTFSSRLPRHAPSVSDVAP